ncbi:hypothetical protein F5B22DRAFT_592578 [Xylaria bambusicola]|uniref:uncharacterized protein n=1 Tax=Xylaria bambusicola TaxID=326684 RepID=UPI00200756C2|nr:uncharacterized protein F5B22DRAFT_592578 [Xylaria bambusicola]KAI0523941.1 hypothetical protein F5B22DRAFT_592578 [Xylaria bambusicola]
MAGPTRGGSGLMGRIYMIKTHVIPYEDHKNSRALMVFQGRESCPLPPLYSVAIYFTHPNASPETVSPEELLDAIQRDTPLESRRIRLDLFFLPSATSTEQERCITHYRAEKLARGDYTRQIPDLENPEEIVRSGEGLGLPGFVPSYMNDPSCDFYHGLLYICRDRNWRQGSQMMDQVLFDPIDQERYAELVEGLDEPETLAPSYRCQQMIQRSKGDDSLTRLDLVGLSIFEIANLKMENVTTPAWEEAVSRGWNSW